MYLLREDKSIMRTYYSYQEALDRYIHITRNDNLEDIELYEIKDGLCECIQFKIGKSIELLEYAVNCINEYIDKYPKNS